MIHTKWIRLRPQAAISAACVLVLAADLWACSTGLPQTVSRPRAKLTIYKIPTPSSEPIGITTGPDGAIWVAEAGVDKIARLARDGVFTEYTVPTAASVPNAITTGPDGNIWFTENKGAKVGKVTPSGAFTEYPLNLPNGRPTGIIAGPDGNLWVAANISTIARMTPAGSVTTFALADPNAIAAGPNIWTRARDGSLWLSAYSEIAKVAVDGSITAFRVHAGSAGGIAAGADGNLWYAQMNGNPAIVKVTPSGTFSELKIPEDGIPLASPLNVASARDGSIWFTMDFFGQFVGHLTKGGSFTEWMFSDTPGVVFEGHGFSGNPGGITVAPDGSAWFTVENEVVKVDPTP